MSKKSSKGQYGARKNGRPSRDRRRRKGGGDDSRLVGFRTLDQVVGAPKSHSYHSKLPVMEPKIVKEPFDTCAICGERIESVANAMYSPEGQLVHFDCVLEKLKGENQLEEGQVLSYSGHGNFAVFEKDGDGKWIVVRRIQYEDGERLEKIRSYVEENKV